MEPKEKPKLTLAEREEIFDRIREFLQYKVEQKQREEELLKSKLQSMIELETNLSSKNANGQTSGTIKEDKERGLIDPEQKTSGKSPL